MYVCMATVLWHLTLKQLFRWLTDTKLFQRIVSQFRSPISSRKNVVEFNKKIHISQPEKSQWAGTICNLDQKF